MSDNITTVWVILEDSGFSSADQQWKHDKGLFVERAFPLVFLRSFTGMWFVDLCLDLKKMWPNSCPAPCYMHVVKFLLWKMIADWLMHDSWYFLSWKYTQSWKKVWFLHSWCSFGSTGLHAGLTQWLSVHCAELGCLKECPVTAGHSVNHSLPHIQGGVDTPRTESGPTTFSALTSLFPSLGLLCVFHHCIVVR